MDPACRAATQDLQSTMSLPQYVQASNQQQAQSQMALYQMLGRTSNGGMMGAMGGNPYMQGGLGYGPFSGGPGSSSSMGFGRF
jgi:hypothetical protein